MPFVLLLLVFFHLFFLHSTGSNNPLGINRNLIKVRFNPYYSLKDLIRFIFLLILLRGLVFFYPYLFIDRDNFMIANFLVTPEHIQPEWYFLFAYAILRSIPNKLGGVIALLISIIILFFLPFLNCRKIKRNQFYPLRNLRFWLFINSIILLT